MIRTFIAVDIPQFEKVTDLIDRLKRSGARLSVPKAHGLHLTLKFLGDIEEGSADDILEILQKGAGEFAQFNVNIRCVGGFPKMRNPRVLWIGIEDEGKLSEIAGAVDLGLSSIGFKREERAFRSHITVARVKSRAGIERAINILSEYEDTLFGEFRVREIKLKKSTLTPTGAIYEDLGVIPLAEQSEPDE